MSRRHKYPPCPNCLACGETTHAHRWCSNGPPPPHGPACECPFCDGGRTGDVVRAARELAWHPSSKRARSRLGQALNRLDAAPRLNAEYWQANARKIEEARSQQAA